MVEGTQQTQENARNVHSDSAEAEAQLGEKIVRLRNALGNLEGKTPAELRQLSDDAKDIENYLNSPANAAVMEMRPDVVDAVRAAELAKGEVEKLQAIKDEEERVAAKKAEEEYYKALVAAVALAEAVAFANSSLVFSDVMLQKLGAAKESINSAVNEYQSAEVAQEQAVARGEAVPETQLKTEKGEKPPEVSKAEAAQASTELKKFEEKIEKVEQEKEQGEIKTEIKGAEVDKAIENSEKLQKRARWQERHAELHGDEKGRERWKNARCKCDEMHEKLHEVRDEGIKELRKKHEREAGKGEGHSHGHEHKHEHKRERSAQEEKFSELLKGEKFEMKAQVDKQHYVTGMMPGKDLAHNKTSTPGGGKESSLGTAV